MNLLTKEQVLDMFRSESILIGKANAVPEARCAELFGIRAVEYAEKEPDGSNSFGVGDWALRYLTLTGFLAAASYHNVELIRDSLRKGCVA